MRLDDQNEMRALPLFAGVDVDNIDHLLRFSFLQRFPAHVELVREGDPADFLNVIVDGQVEVFAGYRDRKTTVAVIGPGHSFIVAAVALDRICLNSARTLSSARILMIPADTVRQHFNGDAAFARMLASELADDYRDVVKDLKNQKLRSGLERLANWLLARDIVTGGKGRFDLPFDKKILAAKLGMAPEVLSRSFSALTSYGVSISGSAVVLEDIRALRKLAQPSPTIDDPFS